MTRNIVFTLFLTIVLVVSPVYAANMVLRIRAGNPKDKPPQVVSIKSDLPIGVGTNDVVSLDGLELGYDVEKDLYYVHGDVELGVNQVRVFKVVIKDIWEIPSTELDAIKKHSDTLTEMLSKSEFFDRAKALKDEIDKNIDLIKSTQTQNLLSPGTKAVNHIRAYDLNLNTMKRVKKDVAHIENLVLGSGQDPGTLIEPVKDLTTPNHKVEVAPEEYKEAIIKITVSNKSPTHQRTVDIKRPLPSEIGLSDILNTDGLEVSRNMQTGVCYVYTNGVDIAPNGTISFNIKIRDKWNVNEGWAVSLKSDAESLSAQIASSGGSFTSIIEMLDNIIGEIDAIEKEEGPKTLDADYVAFYRKQSRRLESLGKQIARIQEALKPTSKNTKMGFDVKAPSMKTTWMIIYVILGFLGILSLLFFLRWFGKTGAK